MALGSTLAVMRTRPFGNTSMSPFQYYRAPKKYFSGGAGLVSTASDYARFAQMLLNGGEIDGVRLLSPKTIARIERSEVGKPHGKTLRVIARRLGVDPDEIESF